MIYPHQGKLYFISKCSMVDFILRWCFPKLASVGMKTAMCIIIYILLHISYLNFIFFMIFTRLRWSRIEVYVIELYFLPRTTTVKSAALWDISKPFRLRNLQKKSVTKGRLAGVSLLSEPPAVCFLFYKKIDYFSSMLEFYMQKIPQVKNLVPKTK